jgi:hypothetical protein
MPKVNTENICYEPFKVEVFISETVLSENLVPGISAYPFYSLRCLTYLCCTLFKDAVLSEKCI